MSTDEEKVIIKKVYPLASELSSINNNVKCSVQDCKQVFASESNLSMHMMKFHLKQELPKGKDNIILEHHCPETTCVYHDARNFKKFKYLKQHYLKVHAEKCFICETCSTGFSTLAKKNNHIKECGVNFKCLQCPNTYGTYESLLTHGRRKKHVVADKSVFVKMNKEGITLNKSSSECSNKMPLIFPKQSTSMQMIKLVPIIVLQNKIQSNYSDKEIQTEPWSGMKLKTKPIKRRSTIHTQTSYNKKKVRISAETQTIGDCILKKAMQDIHIKEDNSETNMKKCTETQTKDNNWLDNRSAGEHCSTQTVNEIKNILQDKLKPINSDDIMTSSTETNTDNINCFEEFNFGNCQETQTDILLNDDFLQPPLYTSHIETQTNDQMDLYSNMYTQTCDDQLLSDFGFNDIQTQTTWPDYDLFVSTETQTLLTQNTRNFFDIPMSVSHMETQTDMEFKQLLEEINA